MASLDVINKEAIKVDEEIWNNELKNGMLHTTNILDEAISDDGSRIVAICNYVETCGSQCPVLSANPPNLESGEPNPTVDYVSVSRFVKSNKGRLSQGAMAIFEELALHRRSYFEAFDIFFKSDIVLRDLYAERCQLHMKWQDIKMHPDRFPDGDQQDVCNRVDINTRNCIREKEKRIAYIQELATCTVQLVKVKCRAISIVQNVRDEKTELQGQKQKLSKEMSIDMDAFTDSSTNTDGDISIAISNDSDSSTSMTYTSFTSITTTASNVCHLP
ncbi:hypothetical protein PAAG_00266 [Paracoccidioides lutzii Pb01]|uniref:Uncharacterized protein n=1 Tax=Paracoccidioides lutzii (strain ATCC MYA-826 / Pb01) TaxID=502779 RepID=C1GP21_PARBA|nr:hypothetical protein PAAG_00266 [Paracoccidioides lutzii Pb01]EEH35943.1 hypothetical protein PAAG_00266 [Paracoccidioides lutzii Pb01]